MTTPQIIRVGLGLSIMIATAIAVLTLLPAQSLPDAPGSDKLHHLLAFAALVLPVAAVRPRWCLWLVPLAIGYGGAIELIQPHVGRHGEWADFWANAAGATIGAVLGTALHFWPLRPIWQRWARPAPAYTPSRSRKR